ncbi:ArsR/SmtB family transcription factor [Bacillus horti]|uniref:Transcription initiation factor IIE alpha subunit n=1 Tax=Caldalkalibacillus horti TaxID=77523 RepID=A0ABT9W2D5_9BACI|nr:metalloregulator ArsR/SmtB family transcription factor [Bacillus horti]MDQ0167403.1 transcription initiation factor IIE alpha subunit [Bacillus horti]
MEVLQATSRKRESYRVRIKYSLLWECALGIAAVTNANLIQTLEKSEEYWTKKRKSFPESLVENLRYVQEKNTWKALLQLLHQKDFIDLDSFFTYIEALSEEEFIFQSIPFLGFSYQDLRKRAANGEEEAILKLKEHTRDNPYVPGYIEFICTEKTERVKQHLIRVMSTWYEVIIKPEADQLSEILKRDYDSKLKKVETMGSEKFVEWATSGITYIPEPSVHDVLLIPQYVYRPWNIEADIEGAKVFYYPVANESINPTDSYVPDFFLTQKLKALGDEVRLKILKILSDQDYTLQDLTSMLELGKSTTHHHLKLLRSARLVEIRDSKYGLKKNTLETLPIELNEFINGT